MKKFILMAILLTVMPISVAGVFQETDTQGNVTYTDTPSNNAKEVSVPQTGHIQTTTPQTSPIANEASGEISDENDTSIKQRLTLDSYTALTIVSPKNLETMSNMPSIPVDVHIEPKLKEGDRIQVFLNGKPVGQPTAGTHFELGLVERGTHQLHAVLFDSKNQVLKQTPPVTFYVHRNSTITSPASARPAAAQ